MSSRLESAFNRSRAVFLEEAQDILQDTLAQSPASDAVPSTSHEIGRFTRNYMGMVNEGFI